MRYELKDSIQEVIHEEYQPQFSNDSTYTLELYDFLGQHNYILEFDPRGYLASKTELREENDSLITSAVWNYRYDPNSRIEQEVRISYLYSKDTMIWNYQYINDSTTTVRQLDDTYGTLYFTYIQDGVNEYLHQANSDSSYLARKLFVYDRYDRLVRFEDYEDNEYIQDLRIYSYRDTTTSDTYKEVSIWTKYNDNSYREYEYDESGNPVTMAVGNFSDSEKLVNQYQYIYDQHGNWIEKSISTGEESYRRYSRERSDISNSWATRLASGYHCTSVRRVKAPSRNRQAAPPGRDSSIVNLQPASTVTQKINEYRVGC